MPFNGDGLKKKMYYNISKSYGIIRKMIEKQKFVLKIKQIELRELKNTFDLS